MTQFTAKQIRAIIQVKGCFKAGKLTKQQRRTLEGQIHAGNPDAALKGLRKILTREQGRAEA